MPSLRTCVLTGVVLVLCAGCGSGPRPPEPPSRAEIEEEVRGTISRGFGVNEAEIDLGRPFFQPPLEADDLDVLELLDTLEDQYGVKVPKDRWDAVLWGNKGTTPAGITPAQLVDLLSEALAKRGR
jgi:acyl carrier protein